MTDEIYSPYKLAIELGFDEKQAKKFEWNGTDATNMRRIANHLGLPSTKPTLAKPVAIKPEPQGKGKRHKHYYRQDGTCVCGAVRKVEAKA